MPAAMTYLLAGVVVGLAVVLPRLLRRSLVSTPMALLAVGAVVGWLVPLPLGITDPVRDRTVIEHFTELAVLVALMGVGLAIDRPLRLRDWKAWRAWSATWKLLLVAMPLCIAAMALLGWGMGLSAASALLLGAALAPTDPVLASDVQVEGPDVAGDDPEAISEDDEVRFALTSEAALNDGAAFPFVHAAMLLATASVGPWGLHWLAWDLVGRIVVGVAVGVVVGRTLAWVVFHAPTKAMRLSEEGDGLIAVAAILVSYGATELVHGYGFLAVVTCALSLRAADPTHSFHGHMYEALERLERLLTLAVLLFLGVGLAKGTLAHLDWRGVVLAVALVFVIRPVAGLLALQLGPWRLTRSQYRSLEGAERLVTAFFGVRGVGTLYYLAYAAGRVALPDERWLWSTATFTIVLSVLVHGLLATPVLSWLERRRDRLVEVGGVGHVDP